MLFTNIWKPTTKGLYIKLFIKYKLIHTYEHFFAHFFVYSHLRAIMPIFE